MALMGDEFDKKLKSLPQDIQDAFFSDAVSQAILDIGKKYSLSIDKVGELGDETSNVMFGLTQTGDFIKNLSDRLGVDKEKAKNIAEDVNQKIFQTIRASLRKVHGLPPENTPAPATVKPVEAPPKPPAPPKEQVVGINPPPPTPAKGGVGAPTSDVEAIPPIFAKKITPIDALLDKIDENATVPGSKPKAKAEDVIPPPPASGIRTMFQDAKSFLKAKMPGMTAPPPQPISTVPPPPKPPMPASPEKTIVTPPPAVTLPKAPAPTPTPTPSPVTPSPVTPSPVTPSVVLPPPPNLPSIPKPTPPSSSLPPPAVSLPPQPPPAQTPKPPTPPPAPQQPKPPAPPPVITPSPTPPPPQSSAPPAPPQSSLPPAPINIGGTTLQFNPPPAIKIPVPPPTITPPKPPSPPASPSLNHDEIKSEIESVLGGKIKVDPPASGGARGNSMGDPYREPIE